MSTIKESVLVELALKNGSDSEFPELCIATNGEVARDPRILTTIKFLNFPGPAFRSSDGRDFRQTAIRDHAHHVIKANAYLATGTMSERGVACGDSYCSVMYFHINDKQAREVIPQ